jgi:uncharacterized protein YqeY
MQDSLRARLESDLKAAMKSGDAAARDAIRYLLAAVKNAEIDKRGELSDQEGVAVLQRQAKRMAESIEQFRAGNREDLAAHEEAQLALLRRYLPAELSEAEVAALARDVVAESGASGLKDLGRVMPVLIERAAGRADGKRLSAAARAVLSGGS